MKRLALFALTMTGLTAAPIGNTSAPELIDKGFFTTAPSAVDFRAGYEGDFVADGRMNQYVQGTGRVDCFQQDTNAGTATLNFRERLDIYGVFGSSQVETDWRFEDTAAGTMTRLKLHTHPNYLWRAGARAILYEWCNTFLGVGGSYSSCHYHLSSLTANGAAEPVVGALFHWREWQVHLDFSYKIKLFTPYIGFKYSNALALLKNFSVPISADITGSNTFKNRDPVGLYVGCALSNGKYFMVNLEGRVIDEEGVTISAEFRF